MIWGVSPLTDWNAELYMKFQEHRTQPAIDLAKRIPLQNPQHVLDVGCGPGNSTNVLKHAFPNAQIWGIDNSESMLQKAKETYPDLQFARMDIARETLPSEYYNIIYSNACLQWVPEHERVIPTLFSGLKKGGILAVQIPMNAQEPLYQIADAAIKENLWRLTAPISETNSVLPSDAYFDILASLTDDFDIWESVYFHRMPSVDAMVDWIKGTRLRPYLNAMQKADAEELLQIIIEKAAEAYKPQHNGEIIFRFRRFFFTATKKFP